MTKTINTTAPALPDEIVERATEALVQSYCRASGAPLSTVGDELYQLRRAEAEAALTAAGVPGLLAAFPFCERHKPNGGKRSRCLICSLETLSRALSRIDYACGAPNEMNVSDYDVHCDESAVVQRVVERLAEVERLRTQLVEEEQCKQWLQKQCDSADDEVERLRTHTDEVVGRCIDVLGGGLCQDHHNHIQSIAFTEFVEWDNSLGCKACLETIANLARRERDEAWEAIPDGYQLQSGDNLATAVKLMAEGLQCFVNTIDALRAQLATAERERDRALEFKKSINDVMEAMRLFDKKWTGDNKGWGYAFERIKLLAVERDALRKTLAQLVGVIDAHDTRSEDCDRSGETYCECLDDVVKDARRVLGKEEK